jgi:hypothetical protein
MRIKFWCDNGANIHSKRTETCTLDDLGLTDEEWSEMDEDQRNEFVKDWAFERFDYGYEEVK